MKYIFLTLTLQLLVVHVYMSDMAVLVLQKYWFCFEISCFLSFSDFCSCFEKHSMRN